MFLDEAVVEFESGRGGSGAVSFHREKHVPRGGPNGADGGKGGDVILIADRNRRTLYDLKLAQHFKAGDGSHGIGNKRGSNSKNIEVKVPVGTIVTDTESGDVVVDMNVHGMKYILCKGGRGGFGNQHYTSSVRQAPNFAQKGAPGERLLAKLELKLLADIGLVGLPNAGKSTLISRISAARPKIADYPFTTIIPNLGVVRFRDDTFVVADMPGLIEGASVGVGLGHQFLKHVERCRALVHIVDLFPIDESDPISNYQLIERELELYSQELYARPRLIALNKIDIAAESDVEALVAKFAEMGRPLFPISGVSGQGLEALLEAMYGILEDAKQETAVPVLMPALETATDTSIEVERTEGGFRVISPRIVKMVAMTDLENEEAVRYLHRRLERLGVIEKLRQAGAQEDDEVEIGGNVFSFTDEL